MSYYASSPRSLPARVPPLEYPGHTEVRLVSCNGTVSWNGTPQFVTSALAGEYVAFEEVDDGLWTMYFSMVPLARYDERRRTFHPIARSSEGRSASCAGSAPDSKNGKTSD